MWPRIWRVGKLVAIAAARAAWLSTLVLLPLFGMWLASSLAAYGNASRWLALLVGLLLFPIVPVGWDLLYLWRRRRRHRGGPEPKQILTRIDRLVLRTLLVNVLLVGGLVWREPATVYKALSVRGDWMLDGHDGPTARWLRRRLFTAADWFRRGWTPGGRHEYGHSDQVPTPDEVPEAHDPPPPPTSDDQPAPAPPRDPSGWPMPATIDPVVAAMPAEAQASIDAIGAYLQAHIADPRQRVKAVHDVVVERLTYDDAALALIEAKQWSQVPSMAAEDVFARRRAVCEGYARLMVALGKAAGVEIAYVTGYGRGPLDKRGAQLGDDKARLDGYEHAWNAARLDGQWFPIDATWDDGDDEYETTYLLTPPSLFILDHFPDQDAWQLLATRRTISDFLRQPAVTARFGQLGLVLREPSRSQVSASGSVDVVIDNPYRQALFATVEPADAAMDDDSKQRNCGPAKHDASLHLRCDHLGDGEWRVDLWAGHQGDATYQHVGSVWVNSR